MLERSRIGGKAVQIEAGRAGPEDRASRSATRQAQPVFPASDHFTARRANGKTMLSERGTWNGCTIGGAERGRRASGYALRPPYPPKRQVSATAPVLERKRRKQKHSRDAMHRQRREDRPSLRRDRNRRRKATEAAAATNSGEFVILRAAAAIERGPDRNLTRDAFSGWKGAGPLKGYMIKVYMLFRWRQRRSAKAPLKPKTAKAEDSAEAHRNGAPRRKAMPIRQGERPVLPRWHQPTRTSGQRTRTGPGTDGRHGRHTATLQPDQQHRA